MYSSRKTCLHSAQRRGFTLIEVSVAVIILSIVVTSILTVVNRSMSAMTDLQVRDRAFELARDNMERALAAEQVIEIAEFGVDEWNPEITWELAIEPFYEPITSRLWMQAVSIANYIDSEGADQQVVLTAWLTSLTEKQIQQLMAQQRMEEEFMKNVEEEILRAGPSQLLQMVEDSLEVGDVEVAQYAADYLFYNYDTSSQWEELPIIWPAYKPEPIETYIGDKSGQLGNYGEEEGGEAFAFGGWSLPRTFKSSKSTSTLKTESNTGSSPTTNNQPTNQSPNPGQSEQPTGSGERVYPDWWWGIPKEWRPIFEPLLDR